MPSSLLVPPPVRQYGCGCWPVSRIKLHNPADKILVLPANLTLRNTLERGSTVLEVFQHPDDKLHHILAGYFLVFDWERAKYFNLSSQNGKFVIVERISWNISRIKDVEITAVDETDQLKRR